jgi:hypothetical protein
MSKITENPLDYRRFSNRNTYNKTGEARRTDLIAALTLDLPTPISNGYLTGNQNNEYDKIFETTQSIVGFLGENNRFVDDLKRKFKYDTLAEIKSDLLLPVTEAARFGNEQANLLLQTNRNPKFVVIDLDNYDQKMTNISLQNAQLLKDIGTAATFGDEGAYASTYGHFASILSRSGINEEVIIKALDEIDRNKTKLTRRRELTVNTVNEFPAAPAPLMTQDDTNLSPTAPSRPHSGTISPEFHGKATRTEANPALSAPSNPSDHQILLRAQELGQQALSPKRKQSITGETEKGKQKKERLR